MVNCKQRISIFQNGFEMDDYQKLKWMCLKTNAMHVTKKSTDLLFQLKINTPETQISPQTKDKDKTP